MTQLEPFIHGGRLGRLLIVLMLIEAVVLQQPFLYMSLFFKQHRSRYYELLNRVPQQGDWEAWLAWGLAQAATHQHPAAHGVERPRLPHRQQGDRNLGGGGHRPGDHRRAAQSAVWLGCLPEEPQRGRGAALRT